MKVKELLEKLKDYDGEREIILSSDPEGNAYFPLYVLGTCAYIPIEREIGIEKLTPTLKKEGYTEDDVRSDGIPALLLSP